MNKRWQALCGLAAGTLAGIAFSLAGGLVSPLVGFALVVGGLAAGPMFLSPNFAYLLSVLVVPIERLGRFGDDASMPVVSLMRIVGTTALASFLLHAALKKWRVYLSAPLILYAGYVGVCFATIFYALEPVGARFHAGTVFGNLLFLFLVINAVRNWRMAKLSIYVWRRHFRPDRVLSDLMTGTSGPRCTNSAPQPTGSVRRLIPFRKAPWARCARRWEHRPVRPHTVSTS